MRAILSLEDLKKGLMGNPTAGVVMGDLPPHLSNLQDADPEGPLTRQFAADGYTMLPNDAPELGQFGVMILKNGHANGLVCSSVKFPPAEKTEHGTLETFEDAVTRALRDSHLVLELHDVKTMRVGVLVMRSPAPAWHLVGSQAWRDGLQKKSLDSEKGSAIMPENGGA